MDKIKNRLIEKEILKPLAGHWLRGFLLLALWTVAFVALPSISGWFLAISSVVFITANHAFSYLIPSAVIRLLALLRTATRYFERLENHKTTLEAQQRLQLKIFAAVARLPYFRKQVNNNADLLDNSTHGVDQILNHVLLWLLPLSALLLAVVLYFGFLMFFSQTVGWVFLFTAALLLFAIPQWFFLRNRILNHRLDELREESNRSLMQGFRGRIEISKYGLEERAAGEYGQNLTKLERLEYGLQNGSFLLQFAGGLGFSLLALFLLWISGGQGLDGSMSVGVFFGVMAQAELAEMLFSGKSERSAVQRQLDAVTAILREGGQRSDKVEVGDPLRQLTLERLSATIPETTVHTCEVTMDIRPGELIAIYGATGAGKSTLLNSLFYPEYRKSGRIFWNGVEEVPRLPVPECVYVTQKAYLLTGTLRENFEGYPEEAIEAALRTVDLAAWRFSLPQGLDSWLGENGETLSGGQRKKLLLAQALLKEPQLLVVDEPTAGISTENALSIFRQIRENYPTMAVLMATHLRDFETVADRLLHILPPPRELT